MLAQLVANGLIAGSLTALVGLGFALIYRVVRFFHFTYALSISCGAYATYALSEWLGLPLILAIGGALLFSALLGVGFATLFFSALRRRQATPLVSLLASLGVYVVGQNLLSIVFGDAVLSVRSTVVGVGIPVLGARITPSQIALLSTSLAANLAVGVWLLRSRLGLEVEAVSQDEELAKIVGIRLQRVTLLVVTVGSIVAGLSGILSAFYRELEPTMGLPLLLLGIVAMIVGGQSSMFGVGLAGLLLGISQNLSVLWLDSAWQEAIAFAILILFLLFRPQGLFGSPQRQSRI